jgi:hypothetical protein
VCLTVASLEGQVTITVQTHHPASSPLLVGSACRQDAWIAGCYYYTSVAAGPLVTCGLKTACRNNDPASTLPGTFKCVKFVQRIYFPFMLFTCLFASLLFHLSATPACMHNQPLLPLLYALASVCITQKNHAKYVSIYQAYICLKAKHIHACMLA